MNDNTTPNTATPTHNDHTKAPNGHTKVRVELVGRDGNAFSILGRCREAMRRARWSGSEIEAFTTEATSGDYNHLLQTVLAYCDDASEEEEEPEYDDFEEDDYEEEEYDDDESDD